MSRATKRKHVINELLNTEFRLPNENETFCKITKSRGNNLHEVETSDGEVFLASMPNKFRLNIWVKRGDFILVERIDEGNKVKGEIIIVLTRDHIKYYKSQGVWPDEFDNSCQLQKDSDKLQDNNLNSRVQTSDSDSDSSDSDGSDSDSESSDSGDSEKNSVK